MCVCVCVCMCVSVCVCLCVCDRFDVGEQTMKEIAYYVTILYTHIQFSDLYA